MKRIEFEVLKSLAEKRDFRPMAEAFGYSKESVDAVVSGLKNQGMLDGDKVTQKGFQSLEPYRVKRAVFLAAGFGSRMLPITINTPKPLVKVHGRRIIESLIDALLAAEIEDIYIVRGYLGEQFELLTKKYPTIKLVDNPEYNGTGTISSFYYARKLLEGSYVLESDLLVANPKIISKYQYSSSFMGIKTTETDDWFVRASTDGRIFEIGVGGKGDGLYKLVGISYWTPEDGKKLEKNIQSAYEADGGKSLPMSYVPIRLYKDNYCVSINPCNSADVVEIDSFKELQIIDESYRVD